MGMFGQPRRAPLRGGGLYPGGYNTPGIVPDANDPAQQFPPGTLQVPNARMQPMDAPRLTDMAKPQPGFFDSGGLGSRIANGLGTFAKSYLAADGNQAAFSELEDARAAQRAAALRQQSLQDSRDTWLMQQQWERANPKPHDPDVIHMNNDDIVTVDARTGELKTVAHGTPAKTETERLIEQWHALPEDDPRRALIERSIRGAQYDPSVYRPMLDYKTDGQMRLKKTVPGKAPSVARPTAAPKPPAGFILD